MCNIISCYGSSNYNHNETTFSGQNKKLMTIPNAGENDGNVKWYNHFKKHFWHFLWLFVLISIQLTYSVQSSTCIPRHLSKNMKFIFSSKPVQDYL